MKKSLISLLIVFSLSGAYAQQIISFEKMVYDTLEYNVLASGIGNIGSLGDKAGIVSFQIDAIKSSNKKFRMPVIVRNAVTSLFKDLVPDSIQFGSIVFSDNYNWFY